MEEHAAESSAERSGFDAIIGDRDRLLVRQKKEWGEIVLSFETRNRFEILDDESHVVGYAAEEAGGMGAWFLRNLLGSLRACRVHVYDAERREVGHGDKAFRFFFHRMDFWDGERKLGGLRRRFSLLSRRMTIEDPEGNDLLEIVSPFFRIWTFKLLLGENEIGRISKRWGGMLKEAFTDADIFGVEFRHDRLPPDVRKMLLLAVFLIDFVFFEKSQ